MEETMSNALVREIQPPRLRPIYSIVASWSLVVAMTSGMVWLFFLTPWIWERHHPAAPARDPFVIDSESLREPGVWRIGDLDVLCDSAPRRHCWPKSPPLQYGMKLGCVNADACRALETSDGDVFMNTQTGFVQETGPTLTIGLGGTRR